MDVCDLWSPTSSAHRVKLWVLISLLVQGALEWLEKYQDKSTEEITAAEAEDKAETDPNTEAAALAPGEEAKSLNCNECGRRFRSHAQAEFHASKSGHVDFAESTEEVAPLTEEEKKARLEELRQKLAEKRAGGSEQDKLDKKKNEVCLLGMATANDVYVADPVSRRYVVRVPRRLQISRKT